MQLEATPYEMWWWDCPSCGFIHDEGDIEPSGPEQCMDCGETVQVGR